MRPKNEPGVRIASAKAVKAPPLVRQDDRVRPVPAGRAWVASERLKQGGRAPEDVAERYLPQISCRPCLAGLSQGPAPTFAGAAPFASWASLPDTCHCFMVCHTSLSERLRNQGK